MRHYATPQLEALERRSLPSAVTLSNGLLSIAPDPAAQAGLVAQVNPAGDQVRVLLDGQAAFYNAADVASISVTGGRLGFNDINLLAVDRPATIFCGDAGNYVEGSIGTTAIQGGAGTDVIYDILGVNQIDASQPNTNPYGITPTNHGGPDRIETNAQSTVLSKPGDIVFRFFADGRGPGAGSIQLDNGVLYLTANDLGSSFQIDPNNDGSLVLAYDLGAGIRVLIFSPKAVARIAFFGGNGNDTYTNNTNLDDVAYGQLGNDRITGGFGQFSLLKGGAGDDTVLGRARVNDMQGNLGADYLEDVGTGFYTGDNKGYYSVFRIDALDTYLAHFKPDRIIGP